MKCVGKWYGGSNYAYGDDERIESFTSFGEAKWKLETRYRDGYGWRQEFKFVNRDRDLVYTPCVELDSEIWLWLNWHTNEDGVVSVPDYPDKIVKFGKRGGVKVEES